VLRVDARQVLLPDVQPVQQRQGDDAPCRVGDEEAEDDEDVTVDLGRAGRAGGRGVMHAGTSTCGPYRFVGVSSMAGSSLVAPLSSNRTTSVRRRRAIRSTFLPAAATAM
jgi:hypothetical protein